MFYPEQSVQFADQLKTLRGRKVAVLGHKRPDGDCIGSTVALVRTLNSLGVDAIGINQDAVPESLAAFVQDTPLVRAQDFNGENYTAITVDCADARRVGSDLEARFPRIHFNIDHHISNTLYAKENIVISSASATGEVLAAMFFDNGYSIDPVTAQALYIGIATDTGQFRFASTTPKTFELARRLCELGADPAKAALELYESQSFARIQLLQHFLNSLNLECDGRVCLGTVDEEVFKRTGASIDDTEGLVDYARSIAGVEIGVYLESRDGSLKGSLRAKDSALRVDQIAKQFDGGGHAAAAGFNISGQSIDQFYPSLISAIDSHLRSL